ncbi:cyclase family protein [Streptomyces shenzhenensis]|uniref:cyclase family protein n=1 Tax=Streptomyces shenzhenensis TaxID=943815 RepID=UPI0033EB130A
MTTAREPLPVEELEKYYTTLSNWGRWGKDDRRGTVNLITPEVRLAGVQSVRTGQAFSLARDLSPADPDPLHSGLSGIELTGHVGEVERDLGHKTRWDACGETIRIDPHGGNAHLDGFAHYSWEERNYNGFPAADNTAEQGAAHLSVADAAEGFVTRGVLLDIAGLFGVDHVERGYAIRPEDLLAAEKRQRVTVRAGDALLIHTGNAAAILADGPLYRGDSRGPLDGVQTGLDASCLPFLRERDVAVMGADGTHDVQPPVYDDFVYARPIHTVCLVTLGLWLLDNLHLTDLAAACEREQRWEFLFTAAPWRFVGSTSAPMNPVAVL